MNVFDQLIKHRPENLVTGTVLDVDGNGGRARVRIQGKTATWVSCAIDVQVGDTVIVYNGSARSIMQRMVSTAPDQVTLMVV